MTLAPGARLGVYEILSLIGRGGMGEVYRARDTRLVRDVAIKVLPAAFVGDPDYRARFEREARVLATLNHQHIAAIHGFEEHGGIAGIVLEFVDGPTLADRIAAGPLRIPDALAAARQIADALDAAHERGIVHRDLKPANIKLTAAGQIKVLDFGLARASDPSDRALDLTHSPTITVRGTREGVLLGTAAYMSPEQARGLVVDKRTDVWAFGCVLFEMVTGTAAYGGATTTDVLAAIIERDPDWSRLPSHTPAPVRRLMHRCLEKDPRRRLRDVGDAIDFLDEQPATVPGAPSRHWPAAAMALAIVLAAAVGLLTWGVARSVGTALPPGDTRALEPLTFDTGLTMMPALSPDGRLVAYASDRAGRGDLDIWLQQIGGGPPLRLTDDNADELMPDFSPDGRQIVFRSERDGGGLYVVSTLGGVARRIANEGRSPRFSPDGTRIAYWAGPWRGTINTTVTNAWILNVADGTRTRLMPDFLIVREPVWAPDGKSLVVIARRKRADPLEESFDWWWVPLDGRPPVRTGALGRPELGPPVAELGFSTPLLGSWTGEGVLYTANNNVWAVPISTLDGRVGVPRRLTFGTGSYVHPTAARDGSVAFAALSVPRIVERAPLNDAGKAVRLFADNLTGPSRPGETADGETLLLDRRTQAAREIWLRSVSTGQERLVVSVTEGSGPINSSISSDGSRIGYTVTAVSNEPAGTGFMVPAAGGVPTRICERCAVFGFLSDNRRVLTASEGRVRVVDTSTKNAEDAIVSDDGGLFARVHASPDDRFVAFQHRGIFLAPLSPGKPQHPDSWGKIDDPTETGRPCGWSLDSRTLYLLLETDGFRCLWGQAIGDRGQVRGAPVAVRHFHRTMAQEFSNSFGNSITRDGFLYGGVDMRGNVWRLTAAVANQPKADR